MIPARLIGLAAFFAGACFGGINSVSAQEPAELGVFFTEIIENHDRVLASRASIDAAQERSLEALGGWYPSLDVSGSLERYRLDRSNQDTVVAPAQELTGTITQMLWDFGSTNAGIEQARLQHVQAEIALVQTRQDLIAEALSAYISLIQASEAVVFAQRSEENIRRQTGLEEARIEAGSGVTTDLLQAKTQLAGAQARRVEAEGAFEISLNRYRAVFGAVPEDLDALVGVAIKRTDLPDTLDTAIEEAFVGNPSLRLASIDISLAEQDRIATKADAFSPTFEIVGERSMTKNDGGTIGRRVESSIRLELSFPFNLGLTSVNTLRAAQSDIVAASRTMADLQRATEERVRNAWKSLETAEARSGYLFDQAGIAKAFLEVAIQERQLGQRSLIDVLAGETSLINAQSDAIAAEAEVLLAIVELYAAAGALTYDVIETAPRADRSEMLAPIQGLAGIGRPDPVMQLLDPSVDLGKEIDPSNLFQSPPEFQSPAPELEPLNPSLEPDSTGTLDPSQTPSSESSESQTDPQPVGAADYLDNLEQGTTFGDASAPVPDEPPTTEVIETLDQPVAPETPVLETPTPESPLILEEPPAATTASEEPPAATTASEEPLTEMIDDDTDLDNPLFDWAQ